MRYSAVHPDGYRYSRFCDLLRAFERRLTPVMRQHHVGEDKLFVNYSGKKIPYTYAEATWSQSILPCRLYAELTILVARAYLVPAMGSFEMT